MNARHVALVSETDLVKLADLTPVAAAVQKQVTTDFGPAWNITATVSAFATLAAVPIGYWPVVVRDDIGLNLAGAHWNPTSDKPFALVTYREEDWPLTVSHEVLEMLADPIGKSFTTGPSLQPGQGTVEYLVEVCDPCQGPGFGYPVNDIVLADFVLPAYYKAFGSGRYSFAGHITEPRDVLQGGYVSWRDPVTGAWTQFVVSDAGPEFRALGTAPAPPGIHLRGFIDRAAAAYLEQMAAAKTKKRRKPKLNRPKPGDLARCAADARRAEHARWQDAIDRVVRDTSLSAPTSTQGDLA
jgi:hypothetical protein